MRPLLNPEQLLVADTVLAALVENNQQRFFLDGSGSNDGKTVQFWTTVRVSSTFQIVHLRTNMRAGLQKEAFANWLLELGDGRLLVKHCKGCIESLLNVSFNIMTTTIKLLNTSGELLTFFSIDSVVSDDHEEISMYHMEFLKRITPSGMPPRRLHLKTGCIVMFLRNLSLKHGSCDGTRLVVCCTRDNVLDCEVLTGIAAGNRVLIPCIALAANDTNLPFQITCVQFPLRLSFASTINKCQDQTIKKSWNISAQTLL
ncbi:uncharacterized protein LOC130623034 [Hydractinia symbiolongicarpus]|uniref:uncharacterized protein LOC130623034 n=1 Tax=Hydractinia symbiolongicarpus TaxID=13093 RepID=UPI002550A097|nr:uncharacterized protein LOC130623034 [Hydractinia symbiolongicarpus]